MAHDIPMGSSLIGRDPAALIQVAHESVSRRHAELSCDGTQVVLRDLGSTNGTWVNGRRLRGACLLQAGDAVRIGHVDLRVAPRPAEFAPGPGGRGYTMGGVRGPVHAGDGHQNVAESQYMAQGDQFFAGGDRYFVEGGRYDHRSWTVRADGGMAAGRDLYADDYSVNVTTDYDPWDEVFQGAGVGRLLMILGGLIAIAGFALWTYNIMSGTGDSGSPFDRELTPGVPLGPVAFGAFAGGGLIAAIGGGMSKAARKKRELRRRGRPM